MHASKPKDLEEYNAFEVEGITVYVDKNDGTKGELNIDIGGLGPFKHLVAQPY